MDENLKSDIVNNPSHYISGGGMECITAIHGMLGESFYDYCRGNILKYIWRYEHKGGVEDLKKARKYIDFMIDSYTKSYDDAEVVANKPRLPNAEYLFPAIAKPVTVSEGLSKLQEELDEVKVDIDTGNVYGALEELVDLDHASETLKRTLGFTPEEIAHMRNFVIEKNRARGYYDN